MAGRTENGARHGDSARNGLLAQLRRQPPAPSPRNDDAAKRQPPLTAC
jgi:hypothetical protein